MLKLSQKEILVLLLIIIKLREQIKKSEKSLSLDMKTNLVIMVSVVFLLTVGKIKVSLYRLRKQEIPSISKRKLYFAPGACYHFLIILEESDLKNM